MQDHQRYFPVRAKDGKLMPRFIAVANLESRDPAQVRAGNERVVRPRLADAAFFFAADRKATLQSRRQALGAVTFQAQLGSYADKTARITALAGQIARVAGHDPATAQRAAEISKCDLLTAMVGEFPELQGVMGRYYAQHDGESAEVAAAIAEQYMPRFAGDALPTTGAGLALAMADKLDTLVGIFAIGQKPTGTKDPYGLRRAALGVLRILIEPGIALDLRELIRSAIDSIASDLGRLGGKPPADNLAEDIYDYMMERLRAWYLERGGGVTTEMFDAVLDTRPASPHDFDDRLRALSAVPGAPRRGRAHRRQQAHREHPQEGGRTAEPARRSRPPHRRERAPACDRDRIAPPGRRAARHGAALCGCLDAARLLAGSGRRILRTRDGDGRRRARAREPARAARGAPAALPAHREPVAAAGLKPARTGWP